MDRERAAPDVFPARGPPAYRQVTSREQGGVNAQPDRVSMAYHGAKGAAIHARAAARHPAPVAPTRPHPRCGEHWGGGFCLPWVLWWLTAPLRVSAPPTAPTGIELHQMLGALQTVLADSTSGPLGPGTPAPFTLTDVDVAVHFVVQHSVSPTGTPLYRLVPVDTALQTRPEHVQTLTMRLTPTASRPTPMGTPGVAPAVPQAAEEGGLPKASPPKKRARP